MANELSFIWEGVSPGDAGGYSDEDWHDLYANVVAFNGDNALASVLWGTGEGQADPLKVTQTLAPGGAVLVNPGWGLVKGIPYRLSDGPATVPIPSNIGSNPRIDRIILRADYINQTVRLLRLQGTPAPTPSRPNLIQTDGVMWDVPLADINVGAGFLTITDADIFNYALPANVGNALAHDAILNNSGGELRTGDVVIWDTASNATVKGSGAANDNTVAGVWLGLTPQGQTGRVQFSGVGYVYVDAAVTRGQLLAQGATTKQATPSIYNAFAVALEPRSGPGLVKAVLFPQRTNGRLPEASKQVVGSDYTSTGTGSFVDVSTTNLTLSITTLGGPLWVGFQGQINITGVDSNLLFLDIAIDGVRCGAGIHGMAYYADDVAEGTGGLPAHIQFVKFGLPAGTHTVSLQWWVNGGASRTGRIYGGNAGARVAPFIWAKELP